MNHQGQSNHLLLAIICVGVISLIIFLKVLFPSMQDQKAALNKDSLPSSVSTPSVLTHGWQTFEQMQGSHALQPTQVVKAIFEVPAEEDGKQVTKIIVSRKNVSKKRKSFGKWEFPGGRVEEQETALSALDRELKEEDPSGILSRVLTETPKDQLYIRQVFLSPEHSQTLVKLPLSQKSWQELLAVFTVAPLGAKSESLGYYLIDSKYLDLNDSVRKQWTRKSRKILAAMKQ